MNIFPFTEHHKTQTKDWAGNRATLKTLAEMSSTPESRRMCKDARWSSALKHVLLLFEGGLYSPVTLMLPLVMRFRVPRKMSTMIEQSVYTPVSSSPCFFSLCGETSDVP